MPGDEAKKHGSGDPDISVLVGIDVGSTSVRAIAFDTMGRKLAIGLRPTPVRAVGAGGEYDPDDLFDAVLGALADLGKQLAGRPVAGIAVTSVGESCVLIDAAGRSLAPSLVWYDRRTSQQARAIEARVGQDRLFRVTGHAVDPIFTLTKLLWMREHWPDAVAKARHILALAEWIAFRLSGIAASEPMLASRTLYFDIIQGRWSGELLELAGFDASLPATLKASGAPLGPVRRNILAQTGIAGAPVVAVGGHDHVLGAMAAGLLIDGTLIDSVGTAEGHMLATRAPLDDPAIISRGYVQGAILTDRRHYYIVGSIFSAGGAIDWVQSITGAARGSLIEEASAIPAGSDGVVFLPHLVNSPPPDPDAHPRGAFIGLTNVVSPAVLYRAVLEGLAMQSRMLVDGLRRLAGTAPINEIRLIGGVSRNPLFVAIKANVFGQRLVVIEEPETTALGAALLAGVGAGTFPTFDAAVAGLRLGEAVVEPDATAGFYGELRTSVFEMIHDRLRPINRDLDRLSTPPLNA